MKKKILAILAGIFVTSAAFALVACSGETYQEPDKAAGNADLVVATVTVLNEKTNRVIFEEKLFSDSGNYLKVPGNINGATFLGYRNANETEYFDVSGKQDDNLIINKDITLYAHYKYKPCTISFDAAGGTLYGGDDTINLYYMDDVPAQFPTAERDGYLFEGWIDQRGILVSDKNGTPKKVEFNADNYYIDNSFECSLRASYVDYEPTVTFDYGDYIRKENVKYNKTVTLPIDNLDNGSRMIVGWSTYEYESPKDAKMEYNEKITKDITLYAIWDTYTTVTLNYVENSSKNTIYIEQLKVFSQKESPFPTAEDFNEKTGYNSTNISWYYDANFTGGTGVSNPKNAPDYKVFYGRVFY